jgi:hypothetical protein
VSIRVLAFLIGLYVVIFIVLFGWVGLLGSILGLAVAVYLEFFRA